VDKKLVKRKNQIMVSIVKIITHCEAAGFLMTDRVKHAKSRQLGSNLGLVSKMDWLTLQVFPIDCFSSNYYKSLRMEGNKFDKITLQVNCKDNSFVKKNLEFDKWMTASKA
jgi:hypothetical protein